MVISMTIRFRETRSIFGVLLETQGTSPSMEGMSKLSRPLHGIHDRRLHHLACFEHRADAHCDPQPCLWITHYRIKSTGWAALVE